MNKAVQDQGVEKADRPAVSEGETVSSRLATKSCSPLLIVAVVLIVVLHPMLFRGMYAGDAEIHLIYAQNAAQGHFFEFNLGEKSPGVTSPGFMLMLAGLFKVFSTSQVPLIIKVLDLLGWYGLNLITFLLARQLLNDSKWALLAACISGMVPGSAYNANVGMENGLFGFVVVLWIYLANRWGWFCRENKVDLGHDLTLGGILGIACWLRPEGFVVTVLAYEVRVWAEFVKRRKLFPGTGMAASVLLCGLIVGALLAFHFSETGKWIPSSGSSRMLMLGIAERAVHVGPFRLDPIFFTRMVVYFPLTLFFAAGSWLAIRNPVPSRTRETERFLIIVFCTFFVLYTAFLGAAHFGRYVIFLFPMCVLIATHGAMWCWFDWERLVPKALTKWRAQAFIGMAIVQALVWGAESIQRQKLGGHNELWLARQAPRVRHEFSDKLFASLGSPARTPVLLALAEIQLRYWLDDRFLVRSLDGRTDPKLLKYVRNGVIDHVGYLRDCQIDFLMEAPNFNSDSKAWSLAELWKLKPGEATERDAMKFTCFEVDGRKAYKIN